MEEWLESIGLKKYLKNFTKQEYDISSCIEITENDLNEVRERNF